MLLSVLIPVYNERKTLATLLEIVCAVLPGVDKELIVVDDCSTDGTRDWLRGNFPDGARSATSVAVEASGNLALAQTPSGASVTIRPLYHEHNKGKGGACRQRSPRDRRCPGRAGRRPRIRPAGLDADARPHRRTQGRRRRLRLALPRAPAPFAAFPSLSGEPPDLDGVQPALQSDAVRRRSLLQDVHPRVKDSLRITCNDFGFELQLGAQIARARRWRIYEVGIRYYGRTYDEGKKINWKDGVKALWYLVKFRFGREGAPR